MHSHKWEEHTKRGPEIRTGMDRDTQTILWQYTTHSIFTFFFLWVDHWKSLNPLTELSAQMRLEKMGRQAGEIRWGCASTFGASGSLDHGGAPFLGALAEAWQGTLVPWFFLYSPGSCTTGSCAVRLVDWAIDPSVAEWKRSSKVAKKDAMRRDTVCLCMFNFWVSMDLVILPTQSNTPMHPENGRLSSHIHG